MVKVVGEGNLGRLVSGRTTQSTTKFSLSSWHPPPSVDQKLGGEATVMGEEVAGMLFEIVEGVEVVMVMQ